MTPEKRWERDQRMDRKASKLYLRRRDIERLLEERKLKAIMELKHTNQQESTMHLIDQLYSKRQARDAAEKQYQAALAEVKDAYPWLSVEEIHARP